MYRLLRTSSNGVCCSLTQYNRIDGKMNSTSVYQKEIFNEIINYVKNNLDINDIIIGGDYNQNLNDNEVKRFQEAIGIHKIHLIINNMQINQIGKTYIHGSNLIDSLAASQGIMDYIDRCKLLGNNNIINV